MSDKEPLWKTVLCWGSVVTFLTAPLIIFIMHIVSDENPAVFHFSQHMQEYKFLDRFYQIIAALIFGMAGLHSWDKRLNGKVSPPQAVEIPEKSKRVD
jgi:Na+/citrate or Na+/malate symporter